MGLHPASSHVIRMIPSWGLVLYPPVLKFLRPFPTDFYLISEVGRDNRVCISDWSLAHTPFLSLRCVLGLTPSYLLSAPWCLGPWPASSFCSWAMTANAPFLGCHPAIRLWFLLSPVDFSRAWAKIWGDLGSGAHTSSGVSGRELEAAPRWLATRLLRSCHPTGSSGLRCPGAETLFSRENAHCPMCAGSAGGKWRSTSLHPQILHICQATAGGGPGSQSHARWLAGGALGAWQGLPFPG